MSIGINAKIIKHSKSAYTGQEIITYELDYPRFVLAEANTHRLFSRNSASSRAIPIDRMLDLIENTPAMPVQWGLNKSGMQATEEHPDPATCEWAWLEAAKSAAKEARRLQALGLHKQIVNRVLEPFQMMKTIVTATDYDNFFWLRCHTDAQPEIKVLADLMYEEFSNSEPDTLYEGEWHLPYIDTVYSLDDLVSNLEGGTPRYMSGDKEVTFEEAMKISISCCCQVSYRRLDDSLEKALKIHDQLVTMVPMHSSPLEHQATPVPEYNEDSLLYWIQEGGNIGDGFEGVTHTDGKSFYSGNFRDWVQYRQTIKDHTCWSFEK